MDGVLVDFQSGVDKISSSELERHKGHAYLIPGIFGKMDPMPGAIESFEKLIKNFDTYILSTPPWNNPSAWTDKLLWVKHHLGDTAKKRLILSHHKNLNSGHYLIDDRTVNGANKFTGEHIHFRSRTFPDWDTVCNYLLKEIPKEN